MRDTVGPHAVWMDTHNYAEAVTLSHSLHSHYVNLGWGEVWGLLSRSEDQNGGLPAIESRGKHLTDAQRVTLLVSDVGDYVGKPI